MITNVEISRNKNESTSGFLRRFTRRVQATGSLRAVRKKRYHSRVVSDLNKKTSALDRIKKGKYYAKLRKLGEIS